MFGAVSNICNHVGGPLGEGRLDGDYIVCPWHNWKFHRGTGVGEPGFEEDRVPSYPGQGRERPRAGRPRRRHQAPEEAARAASAGAPGRARAGAAAPRRHLDHGDGRRQSALFRFRSSARSRPRCGARRTAPRRSMIRLQRSQVPRLRRLLLEGGARLHLAVLDHPDGRQGPDGPGLRGAGALGRRGHRRDADPLGRGVLALFQDGRAAQLRAERNHHPQPGADPQQGRGLHHRRRTGQHPGASPGRCSASSPSSVSSFRSFPISPIRAAGRTRTWSAMSRSCAIPPNSPKARRCWPSAASISPAHLIASDEAPTSIERGGRKAHALEV